jgi:hypothetical protein
VESKLLNFFLHRFLKLNNQTNKTKQILESSSKEPCTQSEKKSEQIYSFKINKYILNSNYTHTDTLGSKFYLLICILEC